MSVVCGKDVLLKILTKHNDHFIVATMQACIFNRQVLYYTSVLTSECHFSESLYDFCDKIILFLFHNLQTTQNGGYSL